MRGLVAVALLAAGCYRPTPVEGAPCTVTKECPAPLACSRGLCVSVPTSDVDPGCTPIVGGDGALIAPRLTAPVVLDGDLADWPTCFITLDQTTAGAVNDLGAGGMFPSGRFTVAHDDRFLYLAAEVAGVAPLGDHAIPDNYFNDAISVYFDADGVFADAAYDADGMQIVVDHANRVQGFNGGPLVAPQNSASFARTTQGMFTIELKVSPATFGVSTFANTIGFDIGFVDGDGAQQLSELVWYRKCTAPTCGCPTGNVSMPYCDARELGTLTLGP